MPLTMYMMLICHTQTEYPRRSLEIQQRCFIRVHLPDMLPLVSVKSMTAQNSISTGLSNMNADDEITLLYYH